MLSVALAEAHRKCILPGTFIKSVAAGKIIIIISVAMWRANIPIIVIAFKLKIDQHNNTIYALADTIYFVC